MDPIEKLEWMISHCEGQIRMTGNEATQVTFAGLKGSRLFGRRGPSGEIVCESQNKTFVVSFDAQKVMLACRKLIAELRKEPTSET